MSNDSSIGPAQSAKADHLCVLVHGMWGNPSHLDSVKQALSEQYGEDQLHILVAKRNASQHTYDGIEVGGERVAQEIEDEIDMLEARGQTITKLSVVGYSLGGLFARYSIGLLLSRGRFDKIEPVNFTAFASPFLGVRTPIRGYHSSLWNLLGGRMLSKSGRQLFLIDSFRDTGRPLLDVLTDPKSIFMSALGRFRRRTLYANIVNDRSAPWYTSSVSRSDPYEDLDAVKLNYMKGYDAVLLDPKNPVQLRSRVSNDLYTRVVSSGTNFLNNLPLYAFMGAVMPIALTAFVCNAGFQTVRSNQRVLLHNAGKAGSFDAYRIPYLLDGAFEKANANHPQEHLDSNEADSLDSDDTLNDSPSLHRTRSRADFPVLALAPAQFKMIDELNEVGWNNYPVHITKVRHSHAAIIVRHKRAAFDEGWVVLKHWVNNEFDI